MPSTPHEPLFASTFFRARIRFPLASILSSVISPNVSLLISSVCLVSSNSFALNFRVPHYPSEPRCTSFFFHSRLAAFLLSRFTSSVLPPYSWVLRPLLTSCHSLLLPLSELTRPPRVRVHSFTSCNCRLYIRRFRLVFGLRIILHSHPLRLPIDDFCSSVQGFAICFFQPVHHCTHLADSLALPTSGRARDFHPIECTHAEHTIE